MPSGCSPVIRSAASQARSGRRACEGLAEAAHLVGEPGLVEGLVDQVAELLALARGHRGEHALGGGGAAGEGVDELLEVPRLLRKHVAIFRHERVEVACWLLASGVPVQHVVQVRHHLADPLHRLRVRVGQRVAQPLELAVEHLPPQQVTQLLEGLPGRGRAPFVGRQRLDRAGGVVGQRVELGLTQPGVVGRVGEQLGPLLPDRLVQQRPCPLQGAVEPAALSQLAAASAYLSEHVVETSAVLRARQAALEQVAQGVHGRGTGQDGVAHLVESRTHVVRRGEGVRAIVELAIAVGHHEPTLTPDAPLCGR